LGDCSLIIVAASLPSSEPVVALARASLAARIGEVPLLIISDRPFPPDPVDRIAHLDFPFDIGGLHNSIQDILNREPGLLVDRIKTRPLPLRRELGTA
jgi:hypothetical protein